MSNYPNLIMTAKLIEATVNADPTESLSLMDLVNMVDEHPVTVQQIFIDLMSAVAIDIHEMKKAEDPSYNQDLVGSSKMAGHFYDVNLIMEVVRKDDGNIH